MKVLIKQAGAGETVQGVAWRQHAPAPVAEPERDPLLVALEGEVETLRTALSEAKARHARDIDAARKQAAAEAAAAHVRDDAKALAVLETGVQQALDAAGRRIASLDDLALLLAETALEKVFADHQNYRALVTDAVDRQIAQIRRVSLLAIAVSPRDFGDGRALQEMQNRLAGNVTISTDPALAAGDCRIALRLGHIDLSISKHWDALKAELRRLASASAAS